MNITPLRQITTEQLTVLLTGLTVMFAFGLMLLGMNLSLGHFETQLRLSAPKLVATLAGSEGYGLLRYPDGRIQLSDISDPSLLEAVIHGEGPAGYAAPNQIGHRMNLRHATNITLPEACFGADGWFESGQDGFITRCGGGQ